MAPSNIRPDTPITCPVIFGCLHPNVTPPIPFATQSPTSSQVLFQSLNTFTCFLIVHDFPVLHWDVPVALDPHKSP